MKTLDSGFLQIRHVFLGILVGFTVSFSLCPEEISADEQRFLKSDFSTYEIDLHVDGKIQFAAEPDLLTRTVETTDQSVHATSSLMYHQY